MPKHSQSKQIEFRLVVLKNTVEHLELKNKCNAFDGSERSLMYGFDLSLMLKQFTH